LWENSFAYFVSRSYYAELSSQTIATADYIVPFSAAMRGDNLRGSVSQLENLLMRGHRLFQELFKIDIDKVNPLR